MKKIILIIILSLFLSGNVHSLSVDRERTEYQQCVQILVELGKKESRSKVYCLCSVQMISKKYSDRELDKIVSKGIDHLNKKTKSIAEKCAKKANAK